MTLNMLPHHSPFHPSSLGSGMKGEGRGPDGTTPEVAGGWDWRSVRSRVSSTLSCDSHPSFPTTPRFPAPCERQAISLFRLFDVDLTGSVSVANIKAIVFEGATSGWLTKSRPNRVALTSAKPRRGSGSGETYLTEGSVSEAGMPPASSGHADGTGGSAGSTRAPRRKSTKVRPVDDRAPSVGAPERQ